MTAVVASSAFVDHVQAYLAHWRALGRKYRQEQWLLETLLRELPVFGHDDLNAQSFALWFDARKERNPNSRNKWAQRLRHFCLFRRRTDPDCFLPGPELVCRRQPYVTPVIVNDQQIARLLTTADHLEPSPNSLLRPAAMRVAIVLLYTTGMRLGELQRLALRDVEDDGAVLRIRESKFQKTRLLPLSDSTQGEVRRFLEQRTNAGFNRRPEDPLLCTRRRRKSAYSIPGLQCGITSLFRMASISDAKGRLPRIHDLRHSFAIQVLARSYRRGEDVQVLLPKLAMYMGHVSIESTAYYLQWAEELAALASERFAHRFGYVVAGRQA
jgi:integrase/recombinase XerD